MGAQQIKSYDGRLIPQNRAMKTNSDEVLSQHNIAEIYNQNVPSKTNCTRQRLTMANFAKIKIEPVFDDVTTRENIKIEDPGFPDETEQLILDAEENPAAAIQQRCNEFDFISLASVKPKEEMLLASQAVAIQNDASLALGSEANADGSGDVQLPMQSDACEGNHFATNIVLEEDEHESMSLLIKAEHENDDCVVTNFKLNSTKLVKNPLAFLKKTCERKQDQEKCLDVTIKSEPTVTGEELGTTSKVSAESELQAITLNELVIKSENYLPMETKDEETLNNANLYQTCLSCNLDSSLDVNLSHEGSDLEEFTPKQIPADQISNISLYTAPQSAKHFLTYEISSEEETIVVTPQKLKLKKIIKTPKTQRAYKKNNYKDYKLGKTKNGQKKQQAKLSQQQQQGKRVGRPKTKCAAKDAVFKAGLAKSDMKKLPKTAMKTRKNTKISIAKRADLSSNMEFPKPFKLEAQISQKEQNVVAELPKPMLFKSEFVLRNSENKQSYLKPQFQPLVRLKRLKSEEFLVPLRTTKSTSRTRTFKGTSNTAGHNLLIREAFSLNPSSKFSRFSINQDQDQSFNNMTDMHSEPAVGMESKYFSAQERYSFFPSFSAPDASSVFSGVATSTPSSSHHNPHNCNKSLLLEIAAERAFINNHLMHFGYSPVQFDLYNNPNELNVFLKFLLGHAKTN